MYISYEDLCSKFESILLERGVDPVIARAAAENFTQSSLDGVYSHGVNRFPRVISYLDKGVIDGKAKPECVASIGGFDTNGDPTTNPAKIEKTGRALTIGYWKGSGLSIALDLVAAVLSGGNTVTDIGRKYTEEVGLSQVMIAADPSLMQGAALTDEGIDRVVADIKSATPTQPGGKILYPGELELATRMENREKGIPVLQEFWDQIEAL